MRTVAFPSRRFKFLVDRECLEERRRDMERYFARLPQRCFADDAVLRVLLGVDTQLDKRVVVPYVTFAVTPTELAASLALLRHAEQVRGASGETFFLPSVLGMPLMDT